MIHMMFRTLSEIFHRITETIEQVIQTRMLIRFCI